MTGITDRARLERLALEIRLAAPMTERCQWCPDWVVTGTLAETRAAALAHRQEHHPHAKQGRRHKPRPGSWPISNKPVHENVANVRKQGGATWDGATA